MLTWNQPYSDGSKKVQAGLHRASSLLVAGRVMRLRVIMLGIENALRRVGIAARDLSVTTDFLKALCDVSFDSC
jgi:hypothetical protein